MLFSFVEEAITPSALLVITMLWPERIISSHSALAVLIALLESLNTPKLRPIGLLASPLAAVCVDQRNSI